MHYTILSRPSATTMRLTIPMTGVLLSLATEPSS